MSKYIQIFIFAKITGYFDTSLNITISFFLYRLYVALCCVLYNLWCTLHLHNSIRKKYLNKQLQMSCVE